MIMICCRLASLPRERAGVTLADIGRAQHTGGTHPEAADEPCGDEYGGGGRIARRERAHDEQDGGDDHDSASSDQIREPSRL